MSMVQTKKLQSAIKYQIANNKLSPGLVSHNSDIMGLCHTSFSGKQKGKNIYQKNIQIFVTKLVLIVLLWMRMFISLHHKNW